MLDVIPFLIRFVISYGDSFHYFEPQEVEILRLPLAQKNFLLDVGLPKAAEPGLHFLDIEEIRNTPYVKIGEDWQKNLICIDTAHSGSVVWIDKENIANVRWFNESILVMCEVLFHYTNFLIKAGKRTVRENEVPNSLIDQFRDRLLRLDVEAIEGHGAFWNEHILWLRNHGKPKGFTPWSCMT
jgi:hypothetical protein